MQKYLPIVFLVFAFSVYGSDWNRPDNLNPVVNSKETYSPAQALENLSQSERENAIIDIECSKEAEKEAEVIEEKWNSGEYEEAIKLLKNSPSLNNAGIGIQWKHPIITQQKWGNDVRIGNRDSIKVVDMDVDNATGHIFAVLMYQSGSSYYYWTVNISADTGRTWQETFHFVGFFAPDVDCAVLGDYLWVAYSLTNDTGLICRFHTSDGSVDNDYGYKTVIDEGVGLRDIALTSSVDGSSYYLLYFSIMENDSLKFYWSDTSGTTWYQFSPDVGNADRGLDACYAVTPKMWASYIGTDDSLYIVAGWSSWTHYGPLWYTGTSPYYVTSIGAYGDTVIAVFPYYASSNNEYYVDYEITYNGGTDWSLGFLYGSTSYGSYVNDVTARFGDGIGVVYNTSDLNAGAFYRHRGYYTAWSDTVNIADSVARANVKPSIERIADGIYGIVYVNYPDEIALFDRSDWVSGVEEDIADKSGLSLSSLTPTLFSNQISISFYLPDAQNQDMRLDIYDLSGRHIKTLARGMRGGRHSIIWSGDGENGEPVSAGQYFCILRSGGNKNVLKMTVIR